MDDNYGALFLDLSQAFDLIVHELLLKNMQLEFGVVGNACRGAVQDLSKWKVKLIPMVLAICATE